MKSLNNPPRQAQEEVCKLNDEEDTHVDLKAYINVVSNQ